jgi:diguanylate cyclase (GGDEF)-like protein
VSFRGRLALFFLLIVVIPIGAIALLVVDVTRDSEAGKADARLSTGLETALAVYEDDVEAASDAVAELLTAPAFVAALDSGDAGRIEDVGAVAGRRLGLEHLTATPSGGAAVEVIGSGEPIAAATVRTTGRAGAYEIAASVTGPTEYVAEVERLTGLDAALVTDDGVTSAPDGVDSAALPSAGESADTEAGDQTFRAASGELPESGSARVVVFTETESGGFFASSPRIAAALAVFLAVAVAFIVFMFRTLQGQIQAMLDAARRIGSGDFSQRVPVVGRDEMAGLANEFNEMTERVEAQIEQLRNQRTELDRSVLRLGDAVASGLDQEGLLAIIAETALGGCSAEYSEVRLEDGTVIERPEGFQGAARVAAGAGEDRALEEGSYVASRRGTGHALAAPLMRGAERVGTLAVGRDGTAFNDREREIFVHLLDRASDSIENVTVHERAAEQAATDGLTGLANRRAFRTLIDREARRAERFDHELSLVLFDIDDFKQINDTYGHLQGDEVLKVIGRILKNESRAIDDPARYGGEEFVVALPETGHDGAVDLAERIRERLEEEEIPSVDDGEPLHVTASFGTATQAGAAVDARTLFEAADAALYDAKRQGKNRVVTAPDLARARR